MQRTAIILACFFVCVSSFAQQYPFVHYTPKDGLISNSIRNIYQDSKGRLYFTSMSGLSVYDGSRFINYTSSNGLGFDIVNSVMEMGDDSIWIVTNSPVINCLVKGKMKKIDLKGTGIIINKLTKDNDQILYAASEQGLYKFFNNELIKLPFIDIKGEDKSSFISFIFSYGDHLLIQRDPSLLPGEEHVLYLYDKRTQRIVAETKKILSMDKAPDGRIWVSTEKNIMALDNEALNKGKLVLQHLTSIYKRIKNLGGYFVSFDQGNNCWLGDQNRNLIKIEPDGYITRFSTASGLSMSFINTIFVDRENITWIATNNGGLNKLVQSNFSIIENPFGFSSFSFDLSYSQDKDQLMLYAVKDSKLAAIKKDQITYLNVNNANKTEKIVETPYGFFGSSLNKIYKIALKDKTLYPEIIFADSADNIFGGALVDKNGNFIVCGKNNITAIVNGTIICRRQLNFFADQPALDSKGNIWVVTRASELSMFCPEPRNPDNYLEKKKVFSTELLDFSPRSLIVDKNDNIWIGSRSHGIHVFSIENEKLVRKYQFSVASGLSDNFTTHLACDTNNNIWACSALGLDKISVKNGLPIIENVTKQNNIYQSVFKVVIDRNNIAWGAISNGLIKITPENKQTNDYSPTLMMSMVKAGKDTVSERSSFTHKQNNLSFYFSATSFLHEKQILYSYRLHGGSNNQWSESSGNTTVSFIDLAPGDYILDIKATFPASRYPEQVISYKFSISPAWWQTWWFRSMMGLLIIGLLIIGIRFYYRRKLEKQKIILEHQQAIEKERTRIASDMHDDLGAGLSSIRFLGEKVKRNTLSEVTKNDIEKMQLTSSELMEKMNEIVWAMSEKNDSLEDLLFYTRSYAKEYCEENSLDCTICLPEVIPTFFLRGEIRRNVFLTVKESLHNIVKHAGAQKVIIDVTLNNYLEIKIQDDGKGFKAQQPKSSGGNGLRNMQKRIDSIGGTIEIQNGQGVKVEMKVPLTPL